MQTQKYKYTKYVKSNSNVKSNPMADKYAALLYIHRNTILPQENTPDGKLHAEKHYKFLRRSIVDHLWS